MSTYGGFPSLLLPLALSLLILFLLVDSATPISFNYPKFYPEDVIESGECSRNNDKICVKGDAYRDVNTIVLTSGASGKEGADYSTYSIGSAFYSEPMRMWDKTTGELLVTNFTSKFSFSIFVNGSGDGITFFLFPYPYNNPPSSSRGGYLGLVQPSRDRVAPPNGGFMAVEFDNHQNTWDSSPRHVGIDINSVRSVADVAVNDSDSYFGGEAQVDYNSVTQELTVTLDYNSVTYSLTHVVDVSVILPSLVVVGFTGTTGVVSQLGKILSWSFNSSLDGIIGATSKPNATNNGTIPVVGPPHVENKNTKKIPAVIVIVLALLLSILGIVLFIVWRVLRKQGRIGREGVYGSINEVEIAYKGGPRRFAYHHLLAATENFKEGNKLGVGGSGTVYRGFIKDMDCYAAIKKVSNRGLEQGRKEYIAEIKVISQLRHRNLVQLIGWCHERGEFLLVYELMPNCSLDRHLFSTDKILPWSVRYDAAIGVASALLYLHEEWHHCVVHRDIKSSNVMLDEDFTARLGDFGLARLTDHGSSLQTTMFGGTMGYIAPECFFTGKASKQSDVYAFGIVALELATGRPSIESIGTEQAVKLVEWVWHLLERKALLDAADTKLRMDFDDQQMERLLAVGLWCAHPDLERRPSIRKAWAALNFEDVKIDLPPKMPLAKYATRSADGTNLMQSTLSITCSSSSQTTSLDAAPVIP